MIPAPRNGMRPIHPGEILKEDFMADLGLSAHQLAAALRVPPNRISQIIAGKRAISADTALRLARYFRTSPQLWLSLQQAYDLKVTERKTGRAIERRITPRAA
jgi:addiction module HigA family antidote